MRDKSGTLLGIEPGEESKVSMLLTQSVFLGIFLGAFDITAYSLLLSSFDEKILARGFIISGLAGILLTAFYSMFQRKFQFRNFAIINLIVVSALILFLWSSLALLQSKWIIFVVFTMLGPLNILVLFVFRGTVNLLFSHDHQERFHGLADSGLMVGIIIISFLIPLLVSFKLQAHNILIVSFSAVLVATIIQVMIRQKLNLVIPEEYQLTVKHEKKNSLLVVMREDPYIRIIGIFAGLSVLTLFFIQYSFMAVTRQQYPVAENMAGFLGFFTGVLTIFILCIKIFVFKYFLYNYGLRSCLIISPVLIAVLTLIAITTGWVMGYTPETTAGFTIFFILLIISRLISKSLMDSVEFPSLKVIYQSIGNNIKPELRSGLANPIYEIMMFISGLILTGLGLFGFIKLIHFSLLLLIISLIWMLVAFKLYMKYRKSVRRAVDIAGREGSSQHISNERNPLKNRFSAYISFKRDYFSLISGNYTVLNGINNNRYFEEIIDYAGSKKDLNLLPVLKKTAGNESLENGIRQHSAEVAEILQKHSSSHKSAEKVNQPSTILSGTRMPQTTEILRLLRVSSLESRRLAIYIIGKFRLSDLLSEVFACLNTPGLANDAYEVLKSFRPGIENELVRFYLVNSGSISLSKTILRLLGKSCSEEVKGFLFARLWTNSRQLKEIAVKCLISCNFKPNTEEKQRLNQLSSEIIGLITWNLAAKISLVRENDNFLLDRINMEINRWNKFLFDILSVTYNSGSITRIRENLENETIGSVCYALEMADLVISDSLRTKLISLLEVVPDKDKLKKLFQFFPGEVSTRRKLLEDIINRDYNLISLWTKACSLRSIIKIDSVELAESVTALLFSPEEIIQEESVNLIARSNPDLYISASGRLPDSVKKRLDRIFNGTTDKEELLFEKVQFLAKHFGGIVEDELLSLACELKYFKNTDPGDQRSSDGCILWTLNGDNESAEVHLLNNGEIGRFNHNYADSEKLAFYFLPLTAVEDYHFQYPDKSYEVLKYIDNNEK